MCCGLDFFILLLLKLLKGEEESQHSSVPLANYFLFLVHISLILLHPFYSPFWLHFFMTQGKGNWNFWLLKFLPFPILSPPLFPPLPSSPLPFSFHSFLFSSPPLLFFPSLSLFIYSPLFLSTPTSNSLPGFWAAFILFTEPRCFKVSCKELFPVRHLFLGR